MTQNTAIVTTVITEAPKPNSSSAFRATFSGGSTFRGSTGHIGLDAGRAGALDTTVARFARGCFKRIEAPDAFVRTAAWCMDVDTGAAAIA